MSKYNIILLCAIIVSVSFGCNNTERENDSKIIVKGHISGLDEPMFLLSKKDGVIDKIPVDSLGRFMFENDSLDKGFYYLFFGNNARQIIYLKGGTRLNLEIDFGKFLKKDINALSISGKDAKESQLLHKLEMNSDDKQELDRMVSGKNPEEFIDYQQNLLETDIKLIDKFVQENPTVNNEFVDHLKTIQLVQCQRNVELYGFYRKYKGAEKVIIPEKCYDYFDSQIPQDDHELYNSHFKYHDYIQKKYKRILNKALVDYEQGSLEYYKRKVSYLEKCDFPKMVVESMFDDLVINYRRCSDKETRDYLSDIIIEKVKGAKALKRFKEFKAREVAYKTYDDGDIAPDFTCKDINGNEVSLSDFKGSLVYIDLWATWCGYCIKGMPDYKKQRDAYAGKKIEFVAISLDHDVDKWKKKVSKNKDGLYDGIQLYTGGLKGDVYKYFVLKGIPQYILIGADGRIIKKKAPSPYSKEIVELIDNNLKSLEL